MTDSIRTSLSLSSDVIPAASLILMRDAADGLEIFMVARNYEVDTFSGALVFPGGKLHPTDGLPEARNHCRGGTDLDETQLALRIAAIREAFEESGVLLGRSRATGQFIDIAHMEKLGCYRQPLEKGDIDLLEIARRENIELATDVLVLFSNLVTPPGWTKKRFDTYFYVALLPGDYPLLHDGSETVSSVWGTPESLLAEADAGRWNIVFPTRVNLSKIATFVCAEELLAGCSGAVVRRITPECLQEGDSVTLRIPEDAGFPYHFQRLARPR